MRLFHLAWDAITISKIKNCWNHRKILPKDFGILKAQNSLEKEKQQLHELGFMIPQIQIFISEILSPLKENDFNNLTIENDFNENQPFYQDIEELNTEEPTPPMTLMYIVQKAISDVLTYMSAYSSKE
ncbi:hypothetical protein O181_103672 [Austropuccinia psidii MF-1]|uniref:Uncharacterized protein n=1 Tax=Austropuccinia psidii MF-1 TaxID=1389203 RepID=A0A9Q3JLL4_9BASI|nr:hypothetical protein [Austropuccinia psidii MF-1]